MCAVHDIQVAVDCKRLLQQAACLENDSQPEPQQTFLKNCTVRVLQFKGHLPP